MRRWLAIGALWPAMAWAQPDSAAEQETVRQLTALLARLPARAEVGLVVREVADGRSWMTHQGQTPLKPASVLKLFVTAAALERFGAGFQFRTSVYTQAEELWVVGAGDPGLGDERLARRDGRARTFPFDGWSEALLARGVRTLEKIVLDDSIFDQQWRHPDWPAEQAASWYQAPVGGLNFNDNCLDARVEPRDGVIRLTLDPPLPAAFIVNSLRPGRKHQPLVRRSVDSDVFEFRGTVARAAELGPVTAGRPAVFFGHALKEALAARGIAVRGDVVRRVLTPEERARATLIGEHTTPLRDVIWRANTFSQNLFAECLLKSLSAYAPDGSRSGAAGSWPAGAAVLRTTLEALGVSLSDAVLRDGSGLSHRNRVTVEQVASLLVRMHRHPHRAVFVDSLAVPGAEGSMQRRYAYPEVCARLRGKTGTLQGVHALAGYVTRPEGHTLAFALLCNGECDPDLPVRIARVLVGSAASR